MSGFSVEAARKKIPSQFELSLIAAHRARELKQGSEPRVESKHGPVITALEEIEAGLYTKEEFLENLKKDRQNEYISKKSKRNSKPNTRGY